MRIIGGQAKGRKLDVKKAFVQKRPCSLRPTSAKVRKALFDILKDRVINSLFLDLYAGSGAVGIEALSRGAAYVVFIDESSARTRTIKKMVCTIGFGEKTQILKERALTYINKLSRTDIKSFDIIFADPPYGSKELDEVITLLGKSNLISNNGILIVEHSSKKTDMPVSTGCLKLSKQYKYGDTTLSLFKKTSTIN
jgi:16S rRNA (guanine(966)-N(2))-methyltransferase RsmD